MCDRIAILTYHSAINYGAMLQAYALCTRVASFGTACDLLDYRSPAVEDQYRLRSPKKCSSLLNFFAHNLNVLCRHPRRRGFAAFSRRLPLSPRCTRETLGDVAAVYDTLIAGSDQVFNPACHGGDTAYLLDFVKGGKKAAYSASIGSLSRFAAWGEEPLRLLADFSAISLREADAAAYLSGVLGRECLHTVDPVWLLSPAEWGAIAAPPQEKEPYIFVYNLMDYPYMRSFVRSLSARMGLPVLSVSKSIIGDAHYRGTRIRSNASPEEFLGYIRGAACVVTDSFHGTSFSMLFGRPFFSALDPSAENTNSRLLSLLETAGLADHAFSEKAPPTGDGSIDSAAVLARMQEPIDRSLAYLKEICQ